MMKTHTCLCTHHSSPHKQISMASSSSSTGSEEEALIKNIEESMVAMMETSPIEEAFMAEMEAELVGSNSQRRHRGTRRYIDMDRVGGHERLMADYFSDNLVYPDYMFRWRFRMSDHFLFAL